MNVLLSLSLEFDGEKNLEIFIIVMHEQELRKKIAIFFVRKNSLGVLTFLNCTSEKSFKFQQTTLLKFLSPPPIIRGHYVNRISQNLKHLLLHQLFKNKINQNDRITTFYISSFADYCNCAGRKR